MSPDPTWIIEDNRFVECNDAAFSMLGYASRGELLNIHPSRLSPPTQPDGQDSDVKADRMMAIAREKGTHRFEWVHTKADGTHFVAEVTLAQVDLQGRNFIYCVWRDITDRKKAEAALTRSETRLRTLFEETSDAVMVLEDGRFVDGNKAALRLFGCATLEEFCTYRPTDLSPPRQPDGSDSVTLAEQHIAMAQIKGSHSFEWLHKRANSDALFPADVLINPMTLDGKRAYQATVRDISARKQTEAELEESHLRFRDLVVSTDGIVWEGDATTFAFNYVSQNAERMLGYPVSDWLQPGFWADHIYPEDRDYAIEYCVACTGRLENHDFEYRFMAKDGRVVWLRDIVRVVEHDGKPRWLRGLMIDISAQKLTEQRLIASQASLHDTALHKQTILDSMADGVITIDAQGVMESFNPAACGIFGYTLKEVLGRNVSMLMPEPHSSHHDNYLRHYRNTGEARVVGNMREVQGLRKDGSVFPMSLSVSRLVHAEKTTFVGLIRDITGQRMAEDEIRRLAYFDSLTGLPNRRLLMDRLHQAMLDSTRTARHGALMFLDLDHFKLLNDSQGHVAGDLLLQQVSHRLTGCIREGDCVARLGGDEFVVVLTGLSVAKDEAVIDSEGVAHKILDVLSQPYQLHDLSYASTACIGIVLFQGERESMDELLKKADVGMYQAKSAGRNVARFFDSAIQAVVLERAELEQDLRTGLVNGEFLLHYQIQVDRHGVITGVEALVRWKHATRGLVSPAQFIPLAEETGLILTLGQWVIETACAQLAAWAKDPKTAGWTMAVNVSAFQFHQADFIANVESALHKTGANPALLKLELTESMLVKDVEDVIVKMGVIKTSGASFSLDDFGTGYSSLSYLKRLPLAQLKIDQSFVRNLLIDPGDAVIAATIVALGHSLGYKVIAEGVETQAQRDALEDMGCDAYQGYFFGHPVAAEALSHQRFGVSREAGWCI
ncbi:MAG: EAL domain-containing protein [Burkholderiales bacterium]|nr:EAL domain-containing protein [Burkholderiales bacterium]